jgi:potassium-transporting ATPase KdpC subunit
MMNPVIQTLRPALSVFALLTALTGVAYPLLVTGIAQVAFPHAANGSVLKVDGKAVGSALIGQSFSAPKYFWSRPSATSPMPNNAVASGGSNLGANNPALLDAVKDRVAALRNADSGNTQPVPVDLVTASGSGLDPEISLAAALYQAPRVARARGVDATAVRALIEKQTQRPWLGIVGEPRANVLLLNLALDGKAVEASR